MNFHFTLYLRWLPANKTQAAKLKQEQGSISGRTSGLSWTCASDNELYCSYTLMFESTNMKGGSGRHSVCHVPFQLLLFGGSSNLVTMAINKVTILTTTYNPVLIHINLLTNLLARCPDPPNIDQVSGCPLQSWRSQPNTMG